MDMATYTMVLNIILQAVNIEVHIGSKGNLRVGPLYANNKTVAARLVFELFQCYADINTRTIDLTCVTQHNGTKEIAEEMCNNIETFECIIMNTDYIPICDYSKVFCVSDVEINYI
jgi:hypothetical protein